jgi:hypothetical protein
MASPISGTAPSFITTVQVIPALINTSGGTMDADRNSLRQSDPRECRIDGGKKLWTILVVLIRYASCYAQDGSL